jgi:hypothetical protein
MFTMASNSSTVTSPLPSQSPVQRDGALVGLGVGVGVADGGGATVGLGGMPAVRLGVVVAL